MTIGKGVKPLNLQLDRQTHRRKVEQIMPSAQVKTNNSVRSINLTSSCAAFQTGDFPFKRIGFVLALTKLLLTHSSKMFTQFAFSGYLYPRLQSNAFYRRLYAEPSS